MVASIISEAFVLDSLMPEPSARPITANPYFRQVPPWYSKHRQFRHFPSPAKLAQNDQILSPTNPIQSQARTYTTNNTLLSTSWTPRQPHHSATFSAIISNKASEIPSHCPSIVDELVTNRFHSTVYLSRQTRLRRQPAPWECPVRGKQTRSDHFTQSRSKRTNKGLAQISGDITAPKGGMIFEA